ncbi:MAG: tRNA threonylcarbamoyladenosine dehydratase [Lachnospiraceae bacterium]|nr:tRNA threonylcarbamoyladenosine dehydratase [Lachnospiraceae bacterium]
MEEQFSRTELLLGSEGMDRLAQSRVAVFGMGGVGGYVVESLVRSGIGAIDLIDHDQVSLSNLNRQIIATRDTVGRDKVEVMRERIESINPDCRVTVHRCFYLPETRHAFDFTQYSYVVDAIDTVTGKIQLILQAQETGTPVISSMGTGNKLNPAELQVADIYETSVCPLAKVMRKELRKRGVAQLKVVYSREQPVMVKELRDAGAAGMAGTGESVEVAGTAGAKGLENVGAEALGQDASVGRRKPVPGSVSFVPPAAGLLLASEVVKDLVADVC